MRNLGLNKKIVKAAGFTLLEFLMVLALFFILMGVVYTVYNRASERTNISEATSEVLEILAAAKDYKLQNGSYGTALTIQTLCDNKELTGHLCDKDAKNPWGGTYSLDLSHGLGIKVDGIDDKSTALSLYDRLKSAADRGMDPKDSTGVTDYVTAQFN